VEEIVAQLEDLDQHGLLEHPRFRTALTRLREVVAVQQDLVAHLGA
jgi:hypothetical protein